MMERQSNELEARKLNYDKGKSLTKFNKDQLVLERIPGMCNKLDESG